MRRWRDEKMGWMWMWMSAVLHSSVSPDMKRHGCRDEEGGVVVVRGLSSWGPEFNRTTGSRKKKPRKSLSIIFHTINTHTPHHPFQCGLWLKTLIFFPACWPCWFVHLTTLPLICEGVCVCVFLMNQSLINRLCVWKRQNYLDNTHQHILRAYLNTPLSHQINYTWIRPKWVSICRAMLALSLTNADWV